jgi:cysteine desulfuration protein SufE
MISIEEKQKEIIERFSILDGDFEMTIRYLIELGGKLPAMKPEDKVDSNLIPGCLSKVWLTVKIEEGKLFFNADSNTETIKGLISLLIEVLN